MRSDLAWRATASATCRAPLITMPGGNPVTAVPGLRPRSPEMTEGPVLVMVAPARTANDVAVPNPTTGWAADAAGVPTSPVRNIMTSAVPAASTVASHPRTNPVRGVPITDVPLPTDPRSTGRLSRRTARLLQLDWATACPADQEDRNFLDTGGIRMGWRGRMAATPTPGRQPATLQRQHAWTATGSETVAGVRRNPHNRRLVGEEVPGPPGVAQRPFVQPGELVAPASVAGASAPPAEAPHRSLLRFPRRLRPNLEGRSAPG